MKGWPVYVIDDQIGRPGAFQDDFVDRAGHGTFDFLFDSGQTDGKNDLPGILTRVHRSWETSSPERLSLVLLDVRFDQASRLPEDEVFGFRVLDGLRQEFGENLPIVVLTSEEEAKRRTSNQLRADGFLPKEKLDQARLDELRAQHGLFPDEEGGLVGSSLGFLLVLRDLRKFVRSGASEILLLGETATGKSKLAEFVHNSSGREGRLETWHADPANKELHYDQLFGHWAGAFDGATANVAGAAERSHRGTFFLDEVGELAGETQVQLLEYRDRRSDGFRRVRRKGNYRQGLEAAKKRGGKPDEQLDLYGEYSEAEDRVLVDTLALFATNQPLGDPEFREGSGFRQDLFERLGNRVSVPPLRERREDILPLFQAKLGELRARQNLPPASVEPEARDLLLSHDWQGNLAELHRVVAAVHAQTSGSFNEVFAHHLKDIAASPVGAGEILDKTVNERHPSIRITAAGALAQVEVEALRKSAETLRSAVLSTLQQWRETRPISALGLVKFATGADVTTTEAKRILKEKLGPILSPDQSDKRRWQPIQEYQALVMEVRADEILMPLYEYARGELNWNSTCQKLARALKE